MEENKLTESEASTYSTPEFLTPPPKVLNKRLNDLKISKSNFPPTPLNVPASPMMKQLGYGTGINVYMLERSPKISGEIRSPWAIKKLSKLSNVRQESYKRRLEHEANFLKELDHPNIIGFRRFTCDIEPILAMEKASSSLDDVIQKWIEEDFFVNTIETPTPFQAQKIERFILDIGSALDYLHFKKRMIHGDIKSPNILVFGDFGDFDQLKICDFGVSRRLKEDGTVDGYYVGTEIWNPLEVIMDHKEIKTYPITHKADMYPFGLVIYEMLSLKTPHFPSTDDSEFEDDTEESTKSDSVDEAKFDALLAKRVGTRPKLPDFEFDQSYNKILEIFAMCTEIEPNKRPDANHVIELLTKEA